METNPRFLGRLAPTAFLLFVAALAPRASVAACVATVIFPAQTRQVPVDSLIYDLKNPDAVRRREAAKVLGDNRIKRAIPDLVAAAGDPDAAVRRAVVTALANMEDMGALPAFISRMGDSEKDIREKCIQSVVGLHLSQESGFMASINKVANFFNPWSDQWAETAVDPGTRVDPAVIKALAGRLSDPEEGIRIQSCRAIGILRGRSAVAAVMEVLQSNASNELRLEAVRALRKIDDPDSAPALINYLSYSDYRVRNEAVSTIGRLRYRPAVPELTRLFGSEGEKPSRLVDEGYRERLLEALAYISDPSCKELFVQERMNPNNALRLHAVEGLARIGDSGMAPDISRAWLNEADPKVQTALSYALYRMGRREYMDDLVRRLGDDKCAMEAKQYLTEMKPAELPDIYAHSRHPDPKVREALAGIFGLVGDQSAVSILQEMTKDTRSQVAAAANQALRLLNARLASR